MQTSNKKLFWPRVIILITHFNQLRWERGVVAACVNPHYMFACFVGFILLGKQKVEYLVTPRGSLQLSIDNFRFARDRVLQNVVTYRCVHYKPLG